MKTRFMAIMLIAVMILSLLLSACGNSGNASSGSISQTAAPQTQKAQTEAAQTQAAQTQAPETQAPATEAEPEDIAEINWTFWGMNQVPSAEGLAMVQEALNEITEERIGVHVNMEIPDVGVYMSNMATRIIAGDTFDLFTTFVFGSANFGTMLANGQLMDITDLIYEYAPELVETVPEGILMAGSSDGRIYGVSPYTTYVTRCVWEVRQSVADDAGIDMSAIHNLDDVHEALKKIKEARPDMIPLGGNSYVYPGSMGYEITTGVHTENLEANANALCVRYDDSGKYVVSDRYETENFRTLVNTLAAWDAEGLVDRDMVLNNETQWYNKPNIASSFEAPSWLELDSVEVAAGEDMAIAILEENYVASSGMLMLTSTVPVTSKEPAAAIKFLNLLYTDAEVKNLVSFGIEGVHWEKKADGTIGFPEGVTKENSGYYMGSERLFGNIFLNYTWEGSDPSIMQMEKEAMDNATYSPLMGFRFDPEPVSAEAAQLANVKSEYFNILMSGGGSDQMLDECIDKLYASGMQNYIDEAQRQLDEWVAANK